VTAAGPVRLERDGPLALVTFEAPPLNLFDRAVIDGLRAAVVNRVLPDEGFDEAARGFARRLAEGPTRAHAATKRLVRGQVEGSARAADALVPNVAGALFATEDLRNAVRSFLEHGPGKATYEGS